MALDLYFFSLHVRIVTHWILGDELKCTSSNVKVAFAMDH